MWCWGQNGYGQLGNGTTIASTTLPVQVLTVAGGAALSGIKKVFLDPYPGQTACALDASGSAWCWGYGGTGQLGTGYTANSQVAVPVLTAAGPQLTGVDHIAVGDYHACAKKTDGTAWCWGDNSHGEIGVGTTQMQYVNPAQVQALFTNVVNVAVGNYVSCATTNDGYVWCWGDNSQGILGNGLHAGQAIVPAQVQVAADAGTPFGGVQWVSMLQYGYAACALKSADKSLWCWGYYSQGSSYVPTPYTEQSFPISNVFALCTDQQSYSTVSYIDAKGVFHQGGSGSGTQVACP